MTLLGLEKIVTISKCSDLIEFHNSSQDDDDDDDDSEPLLGKWFEETLQGEIAAAKEAADREEDKEVNRNSALAAGTELLLQEPGNGLHVPDKGEPAGFISLASHIFIFMDKHMLATESSYVKEYVSSRLSEQQMVVLATIVQGGGSIEKSWLEFCPKKRLEIPF